MEDGSLLQTAHGVLAAGDKVRAQRILARALRINPENGDAWLLMAEAQTDPQRRQECLERAARLAGSAPELRSAPVAGAPSFPTRVEAALTEPVAPTAHAQAPAAPSAVPPSPGTLFEQAIAVHNRGDQAECEQLLATLIRREPRNADAWALRAEIQLVPARKRQFAERALELNPNNGLAATILADLGPEPAPVAVAVESVHGPERVQPPNLDDLLAMAARRGQEDPGDDPARVRVESPFYLAWFIALVNPSRSGYEALRDDPQASVARGSVWLVLTGLVYVAVVFATQLSGEVAAAGVLELNMTTPVLVAITIAVAVVGSLASLLSLYLNSLIVSVTAGVLGGEGSFRNQVYLSAAYMAPLQLLQAALVAIPGAGVFLSLGLSLYTLWLSINATRVAHDISAMRALVALVLPGMLVFGAVVCAAITLAPSLPR